MRSMRQLSGEKPEKRITIDTIWKQLENNYLFIFPISHKVLKYNTLRNKDFLHKVL